MNNAFLLPIPGSILLALVYNSAFFVSASTNPHHLYHNDMINLVFYVNGVLHPSEPLTMDCFSHFGAIRV